MAASNIIVGIVYLAIGLFGVVENGLTALLMATDPQMKNPTYTYMVNLSITDLVILIPIGVYAGLAISFPSYLTHPICLRVGAYLTAVGWYPGCLFMVLASFSRYVQLAMPHKIPIYFTRRRLIATVVLSWVIPSIAYTDFIYYTPMPFHLVLNHSTWAFNRAEKFGNALALFNISVNSVFAFCITIFNLRSLLCIRKMRAQVQSLEHSRNQMREVKLFIQCAITGTIYTAAVIYYFAVSAVEDSLPWYAFLTTHILWISNHLQNPIIYFFLNTRLRHRFMRLFSKTWEAGPATAKQPTSATRNKENPYTVESKRA